MRAISGEEDQYSPFYNGERECFMREHVWWRDYGSFPRWQECPSRPDPAEVLLAYLKLRGIEPAQQVDYIMDLLHLQKSMAYAVLKGKGFDSISRCRTLVAALKMYPPLLGIDAHFYPLDLHPSWWKTSGFSFHADEQGSPVMSEVISSLRQQRT